MLKRTYPAACAVDSIARICRSRFDSPGSRTSLTGGVGRLLSPCSIGLSFAGAYMPRPSCSAVGLNSAAAIRASAGMATGSFDPKSRRTIWPSRSAWVILMRHFLWASAPTSQRGAAIAILSFARKGSALTISFASASVISPAARSTAHNNDSTWTKSKSSMLGIVKMRRRFSFNHSLKSTTESKVLPKSRQCRSGWERTFKSAPLQVSSFIFLGAAAGR